MSKIITLKVKSHSTFSVVKEAQLEVAADHITHLCGPDDIGAADGFTRVMLSDGSVLSVEESVEEIRLRMLAVL